MISAKHTTIDDCRLIDLPRHYNQAGNITALNSDIDVPFQIERVYYLYDVPGGETRGGHGHRELEQFIVSVSGSFDIILHDGFNERKVSLNRPYKALHLVPGIWRELENFSSGSICLVLASHVFDESDYLRSFDDFSSFKSQRK